MAVRLRNIVGCETYCSRAHILLSLDIEVHNFEQLLALGRDLVDKATQGGLGKTYRISLFYKVSLGEDIRFPTRLGFIATMP
jgi:hypothetical protein